MQCWNSLSDVPDAAKPCVATFGNFDGVHRGHQVILTEVVIRAREAGIAAVAITFDPHPAAVFHPDRGPELIAPGPLRERFIAATGVDHLIVLPFSREYASQTPDEFIVSTFVEALRAQTLVVGADTRGFGRDYTGDVALLRELAPRLGFELVVVDDVGDEGRWSSSQVRHLLSEGRVSAAAEVLGRPHLIEGTVVHGDHRGRELGYPTANLGPDTIGMIPDDGVYAGWLTVLELPTDAPDRRLPAAVSIGTNPTFDGKSRRVEAYVLDRTDLDLYGDQVRVDFVERIRPTVRFTSIDDLLGAMAQDVARTRVVLGLVPPT